MKKFTQCILAFVFAFGLVLNVFQTSFAQTSGDLVPIQNLQACLVKPDVNNIVGYTIPLERRIYPTWNYDPEIASYNQMLFTPFIDDGIRNIFGSYGFFGIFRGIRLDADGNVLVPGRITIAKNGCDYTDATNIQYLDLTIISDTVYTRPFWYSDPRGLSGTVTGMMMSAVVCTIFDGKIFCLVVHEVYKQDCVGDQPCMFFPEHSYETIQYAPYKPSFNLWPIPSALQRGIAPTNCWNIEYWGNHFDPPIQESECVSIEPIIHQQLGPDSSIYYFEVRDGTYKNKLVVKIK